MFVLGGVSFYEAKELFVYKYPLREWFDETFWIGFLDLFKVFFYFNLGVSKNRGTPKWIPDLPRAGFTSTLRTCWLNQHFHYVGFHYFRV